jgi:hypothetical protein
MTVYSRVVPKGGTSTRITASSPTFYQWILDSIISWHPNAAAMDSQRTPVVIYVLCLHNSFKLSDSAK